MRISRAILSGLLAALLSSGAGAAPPTDLLEYQVKAAFLFNFLKFVEFPQPPADGAPWVIGVVGPDPFGKLLDDTVRGKIVAGHPVEFRRFAHVADVKNCQVLFVPRAESDLASSIGGTGMLVVGETPGFLKTGVINFYLEDNHVRFEIKADKARAAGLRVSAQLLKLGSSW